MGYAIYQGGMLLRGAEARANGMLMGAQIKAQAQMQLGDVIGKGIGKVANAAFTAAAIGNGMPTGEIGKGPSAGYRAWLQSNEMVNLSETEAKFAEGEKMPVVKTGDGYQMRYGDLSRLRGSEKAIRTILEIAPRSGAVELAKAANATAMPYASDKFAVPIGQERLAEIKAAGGSEKLNTTRGIVLARADAVNGILAAMGDETGTSSARAAKVLEMQRRLQKFDEVYAPELSRFESDYNAAQASPEARDVMAPLATATQRGAASLLAKKNQYLANVNQRGTSAYYATAAGLPSELADDMEAAASIGAGTAKGKAAYAAFNAAYARALAATKDPNYAAAAAGAALAPIVDAGSTVRSRAGWGGAAVNYLKTFRAK